MSQDPVERYSEAVNALSAATERAEGMVQVIREAAEKLKHWKLVILVNGSELSSDPAPPPGQRIDASTWPTATDLAQALSEWRAAEARAAQAWEAIPAKMRAVVKYYRNL